MYYRHFGMNTMPFLEQPPTDAILHDERFERALAKLNHFRDHGRIAILCGRTGVGKTTLIRTFLAQVNPRYYFPLHLAQTRLGATALLRTLVESLGEKPARGRDHLFSQLILKAVSLSKTVLLVVDDAHLPDPAALIDLRLLSDASGKNGQPLFRILLSGQEALSILLRQERFDDLVERIGVRLTLRPFSEKETQLYLQQQIKTAGGHAAIFSDETGNLIYCYSGGIPRRINNAAAACLIAAVTLKHKTIDETCARAAIEELP